MHDKWCIFWLKIRISSPATKMSSVLFFPIFTAFSAFVLWRATHMFKEKSKEEMARSAEIFTFLCLKLHEMAQT